MNDWIDDLLAASEKSDVCYAVTVVRVRGSAPRELGAKMFVTEQQSIGSIGGGQLEHQCSRIAFARITTDKSSFEEPIRRIPLGANCGQCCGGVVDVLFERIDIRTAKWFTELHSMHAERRPVVVATKLSDPPVKFLVTKKHCTELTDGSACPDKIVAAARKLLAAGTTTAVNGGYLLELVHRKRFQIALFGAGHVGTATVALLSQLDCDVRWIDNRRNIFPLQMPTNVTPVESADPVLEVAAMPIASQFLIMTHSHALDQMICEQILRRDDFMYCGLIGSLSKRRNFERRMCKNGISKTSLEKLTCPIGVPGIESKKPADIAVSIAAELLQIKSAVVDSASLKPRLVKNVL